MQEVRLGRMKATTDKGSKQVAQAERRGGWECGEKEGIAATGQEERRW